jgi:hypothetical protein
VLRTGAVAAVPVVAIRLSEQLFASVEHIIARSASTDIGLQTTAGGFAEKNLNSGYSTANTRAWFHLLSLLLLVLEKQVPV